MKYSREDLVRLWREHAQVLRRYGAKAQAAVLEQCAAEVEADERARDATRVTLEEAVDLTGFSRSHLRRLWREGVKVQRHGTEENPEFFLSELPRKPGYTPRNNTLADAIQSAVDYRKQVARAIVKGEQ